MVLFFVVAPSIGEVPKIAISCRYLMRELSGLDVPGGLPLYLSLQRLSWVEDELSEIFLINHVLELSS